MSMPPPSLPRHRLALVIAALALLMAPAAAGAAESPWVLLEKLRAGLTEDGPLTARFVQTYIPAGFSDGDQESGHLSLRLPTCLRWNYDGGKSFLVCETTVHQWNEDEPGGRIYDIDPAAEPGLDLLLIDVATLRERYDAASHDGEDGAGPVIELTLPHEEGDFRARIQLDPSGRRVIRMEYTDSEGDLSRFDLEGYTKLAHVALFNPPTGIEWTRE